MLSFHILSPHCVYPQVHAQCVGVQCVCAVCMPVYMSVCMCVCVCVCVCVFAVVVRSVCVQCAYMWFSLHILHYTIAVWLPIVVSPSSPQ